MIATDGSCLASALAELAAIHPGELEGLQDAVRAVVPVFRRLRLERARVQKTEVETVTVKDENYSRLAEREVWGYRLVVDTERARDIPGDALSDGTLLTIGLLSVLFNPGRPRVLLLDNLERGLHPKALGDLVGRLRAILDRFPDLQTIGTSHSPYLLDYLDSKEIRCSAIGPDGYARFAMLSDHPDFDRWKEAMRPGEFWSTVGDQWIAERPPVEPQPEPPAETPKGEKAISRKSRARKAPDG